MIGRYGLINTFEQEKQSGHVDPLLFEWKELDALCTERKSLAANPYKPSLSYLIRRKNLRGLPTEYEIWYRCKSIVGVKDTETPREPIFGYLHKLRIQLPSCYPSADGLPMFAFKTDVWHPNIRHSGAFRGHVRVPKDEMGRHFSLKHYVLLIEQYLKWERYDALNAYPYPEDPMVAEWVLKEAEPNGWTLFEQIVIDEKPGKKGRFFTLESLPANRKENIIIDKASCYSQRQEIVGGTSGLDEETKEESAPPKELTREDIRSALLNWNKSVAEVRWMLTRSGIDETVAQYRIDDVCNDIEEERSRKLIPCAVAAAAFLVLAVWLFSLLPASLGSFFIVAVIAAVFCLRRVYAIYRNYMIRN